MTIDEGGIPTGGLSDYIKRRLGEEASEAGTTKKATTMEQFLQKTELLRAYLKDQAGLIDELLDRFRTRQLLEELKEEYWNNAVILPLIPSFYKQIVKPYMPRGSFDLVDRDGKTIQVSLDQLVNPSDFLRIIPRLEGYGLILVRANGYYIDVNEAVRCVSAGSYHYDARPGSGSYTDPGYTWIEYRPRKILVNSTRTMAIESVKSELSGSFLSGRPNLSGLEYDLMYSYHLSRHDGSPRFQYEEPYLDPQVMPRHSLEEYLTPKIRISHNQPNNTLEVLIADQVLKELAGQDYI